MTVAGGSPYGVTFGGAGAGAGGVYAPPPYEQLQHHQAIPALSQQLPVSLRSYFKVTTAGQWAESKSMFLFQTSNIKNVTHRDS